MSERGGNPPAAPGAAGDPGAPKGAPARGVSPQGSPAEGVSAQDAPGQASPPSVRRTLERLLDETSCQHALLWAPHGVVEVARSPAPPAAPDAATGALLSALERGTDLGTPEARRVLAEQSVAWSAAVGVQVGDEPAALLLAGPLDPAGSVRPRTLAALEAAARRLPVPADGSSAAARLARMDGEVQRIDRLAALGGLAAEIVHEIRNPLVSVKTFLQLLPEQWSEPDFRGEFLDVATDELRRVERLLDLVLEHARPMRADAARNGAAVAAAVESVVQLVAHRAAQRSIRLEVDLDDALPDLALSGDGLRQVLLNLTLNAIAVTPDAGAVTLRARREGRAVALEVDDEGPGVPDALRERIFEPFFSTRSDKPGGLGLAISRRIAQEAGGSLGVEARPGGGSRFRAALPAS